MSEFSDMIADMLSECSPIEPAENKDYTIDIKITLRVRDVEDDDEAQRYIEDFIYSGLSSVVESDDEDDDHYRLESTQPDWGTFKEVTPE